MWAPNINAMWAINGKSTTGFCLGNTYGAHWGKPLGLDMGKPGQTHVGNAHGS